MIAVMGQIVAPLYALADWLPFADAGEVISAIIAVIIIIASLVGQAFGNKDKGKKQANQQRRRDAVDEVRRGLGEPRTPRNQPQPKRATFEPSRNEPLYIDEEMHTVMTDHRVGTISEVEVGTLGDRHLGSSGLGDRLTDHDEMISAGLIDELPGGTDSFGVSRASSSANPMAMHIASVLSDPKRVSEAIILSEILRRPTDRW